MVADVPLSPEMLSYYAQGLEADRLAHGHGPLELIRTQEIVSRHLGSPPKVILDVGGGPGRYACWLAARGYQVYLVDAVPLHVDQARAASAAQPARPLADVRLGEARRLEWPDASVDVVLLLGPLYHLTERAERLAALREVRRVVKRGGLLFAAAVSRFASLLDGLCDELLADPAYVRIVERDLTDGQHRNPTSHDYFTTAFFHRPDELVAEISEAGLAVEELAGIEGPGWILPDLARRWLDPEQRDRLLWAARVIEHETSLLGMSAHMLAIARKTA
ncbi:MAG: SAM-dependent methyltransferase [Candidatus Rokuibacteriota bacterium]|nr:MAG: SAM-dependent methyltransferase [Candidatus Rokubacteria bacterium]